MEASLDFIDWILHSEKTAAFLCDQNLCVTKNGGAPVKEGKTLYELFPALADEFCHAKSTLCQNAPFFSTKFELFLKNTTLLILPTQNPDVFLGIFSNDETGKKESADLIAQISDRYRSPVSNILNILSVLSSGMQGEAHERERAYLNAAARECYAILRGVMPANDYYLLVNHRMPCTRNPQLLDSFLADICAALRSFFRKTEYEIVFSAEQTAVCASFDARLLSLAVFHLVANAAAFSPQDSRITVSLRVIKDRAVITVRDEGDGIAPEELSRVFEPFYTSHRTAVPEEKMGMGLGLPIVREIMALHDGSAAITSTVNQGTSVSLTLPLCEEVPAKMMHSDTAKFAADKFSDLYILFADLCQINLFY